MSPRVVIAEDDVLFRERIARLLTEAGFELVGQAGDAEEFLRKALAHRPDVVVVDIEMPPGRGTFRNWGSTARQPDTAGSSRPGPTCAPFGEARARGLSGSLERSTLDACAVWLKLQRRSALPARMNCLTECGEMAIGSSSAFWSGCGRSRRTPTLTMRPCARLSLEGLSTLDRLDPTRVRARLRRLPRRARPRSSNRAHLRGSDQACHADDSLKAGDPHGHSRPPGVVPSVRDRAKRKRTGLPLTPTPPETAPSPSADQRLPVTITADDGLPRSESPNSRSSWRGRRPDPAP